MLKSILLGLDGSPSADAALELGIQWAKRFDALLAGLGIVDEAAIRAPEPEPIGGGYYKHERDEELVQAAHRAMEQVLERFAARCAEAGVAFDRLENAGVPYQAVLRESQRYDLVLFGHETHFRFGTQNRPDETLWNVLKQAPRPVVVAPPELHGGASNVLAYNGSPQADRALQAFQSSGLDLGEEVCVLSLGDDPEETGRQAQSAAESLRRHRINAAAHTRAPAGGVHQAILEEVRKRNARLLVMGAYGHSTVREFLLGSVTKDVLRASPAPVFLCH